MLDFLLDSSNPLTWILISGILLIVISMVLRPFINTIGFVYPNAKFEAIGNPFLEESIIQKLLESSDLKNFIEQVSAFKDYQIKGETTREIQHSLDEILLKFIEDIKRDTPKKMYRFYDILLQKMDSSLLKTVFRSINKEKTLDISPEEALSIETSKLISLLSSTENIDEIKHILTNKGFPSSLIDIVIDENSDPLIIDNAVDRYIISLLIEAEVPHSCINGKQEYIDRLLDIQNIQIILRAKNLGYNEETCLKLFLGDGREIPYWKYKELSQTSDVSQVITQLEGTSYYEPLKNISIEDSIQPLIIALDKLMFKFARNISTTNYTTIGPAIRFLVSKELEIRNLKIIVKGIAEQLPTEYIKPLLIMEER